MKPTHTFAEIISVENLLCAWKEFKRGKAKKEGIQRFGLRLMEHILALHADLRNRTYRHGPYLHFKLADPKPRNIHKANVRDRLLHHALYRILHPFFDRSFVYDSYSCRRWKGTHRALNRLRAFASWVSDGNRRICFILKCDIRKFFANIDHEVLFSILAAHISDVDTLNLLKDIVGSFSTPPLNLPLGEGERKKGLPLGNLTSQLLVNIYMNEFDQFVKHKLKVQHYIRYADDFVILSLKRTELEQLLPRLETFLHDRLKLSLHPDKVFIKTLASGVDFLGWVHFPGHRVLRTATKRRMLRRVNKHNLGSYVGLCKHGNAFTLSRSLLQLELIPKPFLS